MTRICLVLALIGSVAMASQARTVFLTDKRMEPIHVGTGRSTILSFPAHPSKVIMGSQGQFAIEFVENDLAISALRLGAHSNVFVYLEGRRFGFELVTTPGGGDEIVLVRDKDDQKVKVKIKND